MVTGIPYNTVDFIRFDNTSNSTLQIPINNSLDIQVIITFDIEGNNNVGLYELYGSGNVNNQNKLYAAGSNSYQGSDGTANKSFTGSHTGKHTYEWNVNDNAKFDGVEVITSPLKETTGTLKPFILGRAHSSAGSQYYCNGKIYNFAIKNKSNGNYLLNLIPVTWDLAGGPQYAFYDTVSRTRYDASGWTGGNDT